RDFLDIEVVCFHAFAGVFALRLRGRCVERDGVRIVDEDQIIEAPVAGERTSFGSDSFLHVAVAAQTDHLLIENLLLSGVETRRSHFCRHRNTDRVANALAERSCRALHSRSVTKLRVARRLGMQLPETFDFRHRQVVTTQVQPCIQKHATMPAGEDENVAIDPARLVWVVSQCIPEKYCAYFSATERQTKVARL